MSLVRERVRAIGRVNFCEWPRKHRNKRIIWGLSPFYLQIVGIEIQSYPDGVDLADVVRALHSEKKYLIDQVIDELNQRKVRFFSQQLRYSRNVF